MSELNIEAIQNKSIDELVTLYRQGYTLNTNTQIQTQPHVTTMVGETPLTTTNLLLAGGLLIAGFIFYYKVMLPWRYKLESDAARKSGVKYSAVGMTGMGGSYR